jgi:hypothetical protein
MRLKDDDWRAFESCRNGIFEGIVSELIWKV